MAFTPSGRTPVVSGRSFVTTGRTPSKPKTGFTTKDTVNTINAKDYNTKGRYVTRGEYFKSTSSQGYKGLWFKGIHDLRNEQWGQTHLWDIQFPTGPERFQNWFPASSVSEGLFNLETWDRGSVFSNFALPYKKNMNDLKVTFVDTVELYVEEWITEWVADIFGDVKRNGNTQYVLPIHEAVKEVHIAKLNPRRELIKQQTYFVFPRGALYYDGNSESSTHSSEIEFVIAGTV